MPHCTNLVDLAISETGFVFDPRSGATYTLNATARTVVAALRQGEALDGVIDRLHGSFEGVDERVGDDIADFVRSLRRHGLVPPDFEIGLQSSSEAPR